MIISSKRWSTVSWLGLFWRMFGICLFISTIWNWFYLYKIEYAKYQTDIVKMESLREQCTGVKMMGWTDSFKDWCRRTWTLQDDPCEKYHELLAIDPIFRVPPTRAISVTISTLFTEPLKYFGQGVSEFLTAVLKCLPVTLQIPVFLVTGLLFLLCICVTAPTAIKHVLAYLLRGGHRGLPPPSNRCQVHGQCTQLEQNGDTGENEDIHHLGAGDALLARQGVDQGWGTRGGGGGGARGHERYVEEVRQRRPVRPRENQQGGYVEILQNVYHHLSGPGTGPSRLSELGVQRRRKEKRSILESVTVVP